MGDYTAIRHQIYNILLVFAFTQNNIPPARGQFMLHCGIGKIEGTDRARTGFVGTFNYQRFR